MVAYNASGTILPIPVDCETFIDADDWLLFSANALGIFSPVLTLVLFAVSRNAQETLNADVAFTSIALLGLVTHPANMVMTIVPRAVASLANFERIQAYLTQGALTDERVFTSGSKDELRPGPRLAFALENVTVQPPNSHPILQNVNFQMTEGSIAICSGPIGSGKSALALTILGEITPTEGKINIADDNIAFCSPSVWLPIASIRDIICGQLSQFDADWYQTVIRACSLDTDLKSLVEGDMTLVGSGAINLSGGQQARIVSFFLSRPSIVQITENIIQGCCSCSLFSLSYYGLG